MVQGVVQQDPKDLSDPFSVTEDFGAAVLPGIQLEGDPLFPADGQEGSSSSRTSLRITWETLRKPVS